MKTLCWYAIDNELPHRITTITSEEKADQEMLEYFKHDDPSNYPDLKKCFQYIVGQHTLWGEVVASTGDDPENYMSPEDYGAMDAGIAAHVSRLEYAASAYHNGWIDVAHHIANGGEYDRTWFAT